MIFVSIAPAIWVILKIDAALCGELPVTENSLPAWVRAIGKRMKREFRFAPMPYRIIALLLRIDRAEQELKRD